jgi:hypothetical protein
MTIKLEKSVEADKNQKKNKTVGRKNVNLPTFSTF